MWRRPERARSAALVVLVALGGTIALGCVPTLSAPRSEAHLDSMAEASRHHTHGRDEAAAAAWDRAAGEADRRVDRDEAEYREAQTLRRLERYDEALALFDAIAAREPTSRRTVRAMFEAAHIRLDHGDREAGLIALERVCREFPDEGNSSRALFMLVDELGPDAALALLDRLEPVAAGTELDDDVHVHRADLLLVGGDRAGARAALEHIVAVERYPLAQRWDDALTRLADLAEEDGDVRAAIAYLERMLAPRSDGIPPGTYTQARMPMAALRIARLYRDGLHDTAAAETAFRRAHDAFPTATTRDDALLELGELYLVTDRASDACALFRTVVEEAEVGRAARAATTHLTTDCPD